MMEHEVMRWFREPTEAKHRGAWRTHVRGCLFVSEETKAALPPVRERGAAQMFVTSQINQTLGSKMSLGDAWGPFMKWGQIGPTTT